MGAVDSSAASCKLREIDQHEERPSYIWCSLLCCVFMHEEISWKP
jgi:hypothetical protein